MCIKRDYKNILSFLLSMVLIFSALLSIYYVAEEQNHNCTHHNCPICDTLAQAKNLLKQFGSAVNVAPPIISYNLKAVEVLPFSPILLASKTPVSEKIRLDN